MGFTVAHHGGTKDLEFEAYVRLLEKHGVDVANLQRVPEPGTQNRWLYVWEYRQDAEAFAAELRKSTHDRGWYVRELDREDIVSKGPLGPITIYAGQQSDGWAFDLHPQSRAMIERRFPGSCRIGSVFIGAQPNGDLEGFSPEASNLLDHVALMLTGLSAEQLKEFGGYRVYDPVRHQTLRESKRVG